jgi:hypothetical protein
MEETVIKLIMTWNIREGKEREYLQFLENEFQKSLLEMGIQPTDAWYAVWGQGPQVLAGGVTEDIESMEDALRTETWAEFRRKLGNLVTDLDYKVVESTGGFQL